MTSNRSFGCCGIFRICSRFCRTVGRTVCCCWFGDEYDRYLSRRLQNFLLVLLALAIYVAILLAIRIVQQDQLRKECQERQRTLHFRRPTTIKWDYNNTWRPIGFVQLRHKIYSAYFDSRIDIIEALTDGDDIAIGSFRVFAILPVDLSDTIVCVLRFDDFRSKEIVSQSALAMTEHHETEFAVYSIVCPLYQRRDDPSVTLPAAIAIAYASNRLSHYSPTFIPISYPRNLTAMHKKSRPKLAVCVGPLQFNYREALRVVEFVELYRLLGAEHFYFYNNNATAEVLRIVEHYRRLGIADVLDWNVPPTNYSIHYGGIIGQFNDCVYRTMVVDGYRYAAVVDFDEVLVPLKHNSLSEYLRQCDEGRTSEFLFRNVFFYKRDSNETSTVPQHIRNRFLYSQTKVRRTVEVLPAFERSKTVVNVRAVVRMGNHYVLETAPGYTRHIVHPTVGLLFHYRNRCINCKAQLVVDFTARRFGALLWDRVDDVCLKVFLERRGVCPI